LNEYAAHDGLPWDEAQPGSGRGGLGFVVVAVERVSEPRDDGRGPGDSVQPDKISSMAAKVKQASEPGR
jgi:hypothetical protein